MCNAIDYIYEYEPKIKEIVDGQLSPSTLREHTFQQLVYFFSNPDKYMFKMNDFRELSKEDLKAALTAVLIFFQLDKNQLGNHGFPAQFFEDDKLINTAQMIDLYKEYGFESSIQKFHTYLKRPSQKFVPHPDYYVGKKDSPLWYESKVIKHLKKMKEE